MLQFAYAPTHLSPNPSLGIYDLTDSSSAVKFSQFILSLTSHFDDIIKAVRSARISPLPWRSDHILTYELASGDIDRFEEPYRLRQWVELATTLR